MSRIQFAVIAVTGATLAVLTACGSTPSADPKRTASHPATSPSALDLSLRPDGFGPARLGMTKAEAAATGIFTVDVKSTVREGTKPLMLKEPYTAAVDVVLDGSGRLSAMGGGGAAVRTATGIKAGSTLADVRRAYPTASAPRDPGGDATPYHQSGVYVKDGENYLGFLFQAAPARIRSTDIVTFMEISHGRPPSLFRDGC